MNLYIMTRGRVGKQYTLSRLPKKWKEKTWLVAPGSENHEWNHWHQPDHVTNYSQKFQWLLDGMPNVVGNLCDKNDKAVILDDDLVFSKRTLVDGKPSLRTIEDPEELGVLFDYMEHLLDDYPLVGVHPRQMGQNTKPPYVENGRIICIQGINRRLIGQVKVDQFPILADVVLNCTLLARGQKNAIITTHFQDHGPCQAPGGCSIYRTPQMQRAAVEYLAARFPGFVKVSNRRPKVATWLGEERYDYTCQWKKLHAAGVAHVLDPGKVPHPDITARGKPGPMDNG